MTHKRIWLGLAIMVFVQIGAGALLSAIGVELPGQGTGNSVLVAFAGAFAGGVFARRQFLLPALAVWLVIWAAITYILYSIAAPTGQGSVLSILQYNLVAIALSAVATAIGAILGQMLAASRSQHAAAT